MLNVSLFCGDLEERNTRSEVEDTTENELSDPEDDLTDSQQTNKLSELYSTTIPSVDSAMESWDGSGLDTGFGSQGKLQISSPGGQRAGRAPKTTQRFLSINGLICAGHFRFPLKELRRT